MIFRERKAWVIVDTSRRQIIDFSLDKPKDNGDGYFITDTGTYYEKCFYGIERVRIVRDND